MHTDASRPGFIQSARTRRRGQTLVEVLVAIAILSVIVVFISADLTNVTRLDTATDRSLEVGAANFLLGVMKSDPTFWTPPGSNDWATGPGQQCVAPLGPYTDMGPSPAPNWHQMPQAPAGCPEIPYNEPGGPQSFPSGGPSAPPVGNSVEYMWNASYHGTDPWAADLTVWVRRDAGSPIFEYHAIRYVYPGLATPTPIASGGTPTPTPSPTIPPSPTPTPSPRPTPSATPTRPPTPTPSPTPIGV